MTPTDPTMLTILAVLQALTVAGVVASIGFAFRINGQLQAILARLDHLEPVTGRVQEIHDKVIRHDGELEAVRLRVGHVEEKVDAMGR